MSIQVDKNDTTCPMCGKTGKTRQTLSHHVREQHGTTLTKLRRTKETKERIVPINPPPPPTWAFPPVEPSLEDLDASFGLLVKAMFPGGIPEGAVEDVATWLARGIAIANRVRTGTGERGEGR